MKAAAVLAAGFVAGSMGLASAGTLPAPVQEVAHNALGAVGINVPPGHDRYDGPECGGTYANHGEYVRSHKDDPNAGQSRCGKPSKAGKADGTEQAEAEGEGTQGPPPWVNGNGKGNGQGSGNGADKPAKVKGGKGKGAADDDGNGAAEPSAPAPGTDVTTTTGVTAAPTTTTTTTSMVATTTTAATSTTTAPPVTTTSTSTPELPATTTVP